MHFIRELGARTGSPDGRTGNTRNAPYIEGLLGRAHNNYVRNRAVYNNTTTRLTLFVWLGGLVVSALGMRTRRPRFESRVAPLFHWVATLGKLFAHIASKGSFRRLSGYDDYVHVLEL